MRFSTFILAIVIVATGATVSLAQPRYGVNPFAGFFDPYNRSSGPIPRTVVSFQSNYAPGTVYIDTSERRLYLVIRPGLAIRYGIGIGRDGYGWSGVHRVSAKREWPNWTPPSQMLARRPDLPRFMPGASTIPSGREPCTLDRHFIAFTARTSPKQSGRPS